MMRLRVASLFLAVVLGGCPAVYPELGTRTRAVSVGQPLDPPPPPELRWLKFVSARVPDRTRDGRQWQANGKASVYAKLLVNGKELLRTPPEADTLTPTWPGSPHGNFRIVAADRLRVELWAADPVNDVPVGGCELGVVDDLKAADGTVHVSIEDASNASAEVVLAFEPAHAVSGLGLWYELRTTGCAVTRLLEGSPAERAGILPGDEVVRMGGREAKIMSPDEIRSAFNAVPVDGIALLLRHPSGTVAEVTLKDGPIYPTFDQFGPVD